MICTIRIRTRTCKSHRLSDRTLPRPRSGSSALPRSKRSTCPPAPASSTCPRAACAPRMRPARDPHLSEGPGPGLPAPARAPPRRTSPNYNISPPARAGSSPGPGWARRPRRTARTTSTRGARSPRPSSGPPRTRSCHAPASVGTGPDPGCRARTPSSGSSPGRAEASWGRIWISKATVKELASVAEKAVWRSRVRIFGTGIGLEFRERRSEAAPFLAEF